MKRKSTYYKSLAGALALSVSMPAIVIPVETQTVEAASSSFKDVPTKHWAYSSIMKASQQGFVEGYNGKFNPNDNVTRAEFAQILSRVFDGKERVKNSFPDVSSTFWGADAINEGIALGFIKPADFTNNKFNPNQAMTRGEIAKWFVDGLVAKNPEYAKVFKEFESDLTLLPVAEYLKGGIAKKDIPYVAVALGTGLMTGYTDYSFKPSGKTTRAEVVTMLFRYLDIIEKDPSSFSDLNEFREVAATGTNIYSITPYEGTEYGSYKDVLGKNHTFLNGLGIGTIERAIYVDVTGSSAKGAYKDMFFDNAPVALNRNYYEIYTEYTVVPNKDTSLFSIGNGSTLDFAPQAVINSVNAEQFGIKTPESVSQNYFKKGVKTKYWGISSVLKGEKIDGSTDDGSRFYYVMPK